MTELRAAWQITQATLQQRSGSLLTFTAIATAFHLITAVSLDFIGGLDTVESTIKSFSPGMRQLLKITPELQADYGLQAHLAYTWMHPFFIGLCAMFVVGRAADALAGEIESGSVYLLLSRPIPRWTLVLGRMGEIGIGLAVILVMSVVGMAVGVAIAELGSLPLGRYLVLAATAWCLFMALSPVALVASSLASRVGMAAALGTVWALATYVLDVLPQVSNSPLAWLNPWHFYFPPGTIAGGSVDGLGLVVMLGWLAAAVLLAMQLFGRRDLI